LWSLNVRCGSRCKGAQLRSKPLRLHWLDQLEVVGVDLLELYVGNDTPHARRAVILGGIEDLGPPMLRASRSAGRPIFSPDVRDDFPLFLLVLFCVLGGLSVAGVAYAGQSLQSRRPDQLPTALEGFGIGPPKRPGSCLTSFRSLKQLHGSASRTTFLGARERQLFACTPFSDIPAGRGSALRVPGGTTPGQFDTQEASPPDAIEAPEEGQSRVLIDRPDEQKLMEMGVPPILAIRDFCRGHGPNDPILDPAPFPALAEALFRLLHLLELVLEIITPLVARSERDHDRLEALPARPGKGLIQFAPARLTDPATAAGAEPDRTAGLKAREMRAFFACRVSRQRHIDPGLLRDHGPLAEAHPFLRHELRRVALELKVALPARLVVRLLVNRFRSIAKAGVCDPLFAALRHASRAARAARRPAARGVGGSSHDLLRKFISEKHACAPYGAG
jgi:hypothetical protein